MSKGLTVMMDAHNDILAYGSVNTDYQGFTGSISSRGSYPLMDREGFQIKTGHFNLVALTATKVTADNDTKDIAPKARNCLFPEENSEMKIHREYSQANCLLECALFFAQNMLLENNNNSLPCFPWYFPTNKERATLCDAWSAADFESYFNNVPDDQCPHCLPDCSSVIYDPTITAIPFRRCDFRNFGVSNLCKLDDPFLPQPQVTFYSKFLQIFVTFLSKLACNPMFINNFNNIECFLLIIGCSKSLL